MTNLLSDVAFPTPLEVEVYVNCIEDIHISNIMHLVRVNATAVKKSLYEWCDRKFDKLYAIAEINNEEVYYVDTIDIGSVIHVELQNREDFVEELINETFTSTGDLDQDKDVMNHVLVLRHYCPDILPEVYR